MRCPNCKSTDLAPWQGEVNLAGVSVTSQGDRCTNCGEVLLAPEAIRNQEQLAARAIAERGIRSGHELKYVRKAAGFTAREVAALIGVTPESMSRWERGSVPIPRYAAFIVAELLRDREHTERHLRALAGSPTSTS